MTIQLGSESYPFMAITKHFGVPYADVIAYYERIPSAMLQRHEPWMREAWKVYYRRHPDEVADERDVRCRP